MPFAVLPTRLFPNLTRFVALAAFAGATLPQAQASTLDLDELIRPPSEPQKELKFAVPGEESSMSVEQRLQIRAAIEAFSAERFEDMAAIGRDLTEKAPAAGEGWYILGLALANLEDFDAALDALDVADARFKKNLQPLIFKGGILETLKRPDEAVAVYVRATERDPSLYTLHEKIALFAEQTGDPEGARERWQLAIENGPQDRLFPRARLARNLVQAEQSEAALILMSNFAANNPDSLEALAAFGHVQQMTKDFDGAAKTFTNLTNQSPRDASAALLLARSLVSGNRLDDASEALRQATTRIPGSVLLESELAKLLGASRDYAGSRAAYGRALELDPDNPDFVRGVSLASYRLNDMERALSQAARLVSLNPSNPNSVMWLASMQQNGGLTEEAIKTYQRVLELTPKNWVALNNLSVLLLDKDPELALELAQRSVENSENQAAARNTLGQASLAANQPGEAVGIFADLVGEHDANPLYRFRYGLALIADGKKSDGRAQIETALEIDSEFSKADEARAVLSRMD